MNLIRAVINVLDEKQLRKTLLLLAEKIGTEGNWIGNYELEDFLAKVTEEE